MSDSFKSVIRVPLADKYAYVELTYEGSPEAIMSVYDHFTRLAKVGEGLPAQEWNQTIDKYFDGKGIAPDVWERCNKAQQWLLHEIDKSKGRIAPKIPAKRKED